MRRTVQPPRTRTTSDRSKQKDEKRAMKDTDGKRAKKGNKRARGMDTAASKKDKDEAQEDVAERGEKRPNLVLRTREEVLKARLFARYAYEMERRGASGSGPV